MRFHDISYCSIDKIFVTFSLLYYQIVRSYCLSRDYPKSYAAPPSKTALKTYFGAKITFTESSSSGTVVNTLLFLNPPCHTRRLVKNTLKSYDTSHTNSYQTVRSYCLSRDCPKSYARRLKSRLQKLHTSERKSPLWNNINPSNMKNIFKNTKSLTGDLI